MTTKVTIAVEDGGAWDAMVTERTKHSDGTVHDGIGTLVQQGESKDFWIHDSLGFEITEVAIEDDAASDDVEDEEVEEVEEVETAPVGDED